MEATNALEKTYLDYIAAINQRPFPGVAEFMHETVSLNAVPMPRAEFEKLLSDDINAAPDLRWDLYMLLADEAKQQVGCRIEFRCTPTSGEFMDQKVEGTVKCMEHMFYQYRDGKIAEVWWMPGELIPADSEGTHMKI